MNEAAYVFNQTNRDRAITRRSASHKVSGAKSHKVSLSTDNLTQKQLASLHGEVSTYPLAEPVDFVTFKSWPRHIQLEYIERLRTVYAVTAKTLGEFFGCSTSTMHNIMHDIGVQSDNSKRVRPTNAQKAAFAEWAAGCAEPSSDEAQSPTPEEPQDAAQATTACEAGFPVITAGSLTLTGKPTEVLQKLYALFSGIETPHAMTLTWEVMRDAEV